MTGYELFKKVCALLGYYDLHSGNDNAKSTVFCDIVNQIAQDLNIKEIKTLSEKIICKPYQKEALTYGCAMLFSVSLSDSGCAAMYSELYNSKRCKALSACDIRADVLPSPKIGGI